MYLKYIHIGTGDKEYYFWKNYFFHCAMIRFNIGLSNSEIWDVPTVSSSAKVQQSSSLITSIPFFAPVTAPTDSSQSRPSNVGSLSAGESPEEEDEVSITFDSASMGSSSPTSQQSNNKKYSSRESASSPPSSTTDVAASERNAPMSPERDYEIIVPSEEANNSNNNDEDAIDLANELDLGALGDGDSELDDLEAEIARELED